MEQQSEKNGEANESATQEPHALNDEQVYALLKLKAANDIAHEKIKTFCLFAFLIAVVITISLVKQLVPYQQVLMLVIIPTMIMSAGLFHSLKTCSERRKICVKLGCNPDVDLTDAQFAQVISTPKRTDASLSA